MSKSCDESEWVLGDVNNNLGEHMFPESKYDWNRPKQLCLSPLVAQGRLGDKFIMYAEGGGSVIVKNRDNCLSVASQVLVCVHHM